MALGNIAKAKLGFSAWNDIRDEGPLALDLNGNGEAGLIFPAM